MFQFKKIDKLLSYRFYDYKIELFLDKKFEFDFLYNIFKNKLLILQKYFKKNFNKKFIRFNFFKYFFPIFFVKKSDKNLCFCVNYRKFNVIIKKNKYSILFVQKILDRLCNVKYFIKINIIIVFNCLKITFENKKYIVFRTCFDLFEYFVMFFELCNALFF